MNSISIRIIIILSIATTSVVAMSFMPMHRGGRLILHFQNYVGDKRVMLDTVTYYNELGQPFTVTNFKYYISNVSLNANDGRNYVVRDSYFLIKQDDESTWTANLDNVPDGDYSSISFMIGVDSLHNCNGAQSGALDPVNGMYWTWNTGYIFLKLEGKSPASKSPGGIFEYHIGGYKEPNNVIRYVTLTTGKIPATINADKITELVIKADVAEVLKHPNTIDFAKLSSVTDFRHAAEMADNYIDMFSITNIINEM